MGIVLTYSEIEILSDYAGINEIPLIIVNVYDTPFQTLSLLMTNLCEMNTLFILHRVSINVFIVCPFLKPAKLICLLAGRSRRLHSEHQCARFRFQVAVVFELFAIEPIGP